MHGLAVTRCEGFDDGPDPYVFRPCLVVGEGHPQELVAEHVVAAGVLVGETGPAQRHQAAVHGRFRAADHPGEFFEADPVGMPGQFLEHGEDPVRPDESRVFQGGNIGDIR